MKTNKLKIVYLTDQINVGGTEKQLLAVIERLNRNKFEPYLICLRPSEYFENYDINCQKILLNVTSLLSWNGLLEWFRFVIFLRQKKINIVQTYFFDPTVFGVFAARLAGVSRIISCRRDMGYWYTPKYLMLLSFINLFTHRIVVNSEAIKKKVCTKERVNKKKIDVIYNGINLVPFSVQNNVSKLRNELGIPVTDKVVGIVANLNRRVKRVDLFIDAAAGVLQKWKNVSFIVVGEGAFREELEVQAKVLGISQKLFFVGSQDDVIPYLQLFDVGVLTSESEGFANSILEYMAAGLPVVCFDTGGNNELVVQGENGCLCIVNNSKCISTSVLSLLENEVFSSEISKKNLEVVRKFEWSIKLNQYQKYIDSIL